MADDRNRMQILEMIENGQITAAEGLRLLQSISSTAGPELDAEAGTGLSAAASQSPAGGNAEPAAPSQAAAWEIGEASFPDAAKQPDEDLPHTHMPDFEKWRTWWLVPLWVGVGVTVAGGLLLYEVLQASGVGFWFFCASLPFLIGLALIVMAWQSRTSKWLHIRIDRVSAGQSSAEWPRRFALSLPLPLRLTAWFVRTFGDRIPNLRGTSIDEVILALGTSTSPGRPFYMEVEDDEDGERVQIFIG